VLTTAVGCDRDAGKPNGPTARTSCVRIRTYACVGTVRAEVAEDRVCGMGQSPATVQPPADDSEPAVAEATPTTAEENPRRPVNDLSPSRAVPPHRGRRPAPHPSGEAFPQPSSAATSPRSPTWPLWPTRPSTGRMPTPPTDPAICDFCSYWFNGPAHRPSPRYRRMGYPTDRQRPCHEGGKALTTAARTPRAPLHGRGGVNRFHTAI
jgi:hypothetical protein